MNKNEQERWIQLMKEYIKARRDIWRMEYRVRVGNEKSDPAVYAKADSVFSEFDSELDAKFEKEYKNWVKNSEKHLKDFK